MERDCHFCTETERLEQHHIVPRRFDGSDDDENLVTVCPTCHSKLESLYDKRFYDEIGAERPSQSETDYGTCGVDGCRATASNSLESPYAKCVVCETHFTCDSAGCNDRPENIVKTENGILKLCEEHNVCNKDGCYSDRELVYTRNRYGKKRLYCPPHAAEVSQSKRISEMVLGGCDD